jgi:hypothetical protein
MIRHSAEFVAKTMEAHEPPFTGRYVCRPLPNGKVEVFDLMKESPVGHYYEEIGRECCAKLNASVARPLFPVSTVAMPCSQCGANVIVAANVDTVQCRDCQRMVVDSALSEVLVTTKALRDGVAPFHILTPAERAEQLTALIGDVVALPDGAMIELAGKCAEILASRMPTPERIIDPAADFVWSSDGFEPDAQTRDELESRIEATADNVPPVDEYFNELDQFVRVRVA